MKTIIYKENDIDYTTLKIAIKNGKIVIFPTETVYGIGTNALDSKAVEKIYEVKKRPEQKPLIVLIHDKKMLFSLVDSVNEIEERLMDAFWPGPLTIIFPVKQGVLPSIVTAGTSTVAIRYTNGKIAKELLTHANVPIVAPSANMSGEPTGIHIENIIKDFNEKADYIIDCGDIQSDTVSTLVKVENNKILCLREGAISKNELESIASVIVK